MLFWFNVRSHELEAIVEIDRVRYHSYRKTEMLVL